MLASLTINLTDQMIHAIASGFLVLCAAVAGRKSIYYVLSHIRYGGRRTAKGATMNFKTLSIVNLLCGAGLVSGTSYLPHWVWPNVETGSSGFPLMYVVGLGLPIAVGIIVTLAVSLSEDSKPLRKWRYKVTDKSKYVKTK